MLRIRLLRILLPLMLLAVGWGLYLSWVPRNTVHTVPERSDQPLDPQAPGVYPAGTEYTRCFELHPAALMQVYNVCSSAGLNLPPQRYVLTHVVA